ncbi:MAG: glycosyltransferase family 39 protein [Candidatus Hinthialibacter antarcticus]|nr:glycosyltransferase family 39 protein [Candidatus Hinthialibacter antarcticus]
MNSADGSVAQRNSALLLPALLCLQALLFLIDHFINFKPLWVDEGYSALLARRSFSEIHQALIYDAGPPLYYDLLHIWRAVFGESELALRSLSLLFGLLSTVLLYHFAKRWLSPRTAFYAALIWVVHPLSLFYLSQARNYTLLIALAIWYADRLLAYLHTQKFTDLLQIALALTLSVYNHNIAWYVAMAGGLSSLYFTRDWKRIGALFIAHVIPVLFFLPWLPVMQQQLANTEMTTAWIKDVWTVFAPLISILCLSIGATLNHMTHPWTLLLFLPMLAFWPIINYRWPDFFPDEQKKRVRWLRLFSIFLLLGPWLQSVLSDPIYIITRTDFIALPFLAIAVAPGFTRFPNLKLLWKTLILIGLVAPILVAVGFGVGSERGIPTSFGQKYLSEKTITDYIERQGKPGDIVICTDVSRPVIEYYLSPKGFNFTSFPPDMNDQLAHYNENWYRENLNLEQEAITTIQTAKNLLQEDSSMWVVVSFRSPVSKFLEEALQSDAELFGSPNPIRAPRMGIRMPVTDMFIFRYEQR